MKSRRETVDELAALVDEITVDTAGDDEQLWAFRQALETHLVVPADAFVIGEPVSVVTFDYDGNIRRGLTAKCRRANGEEYTVAAVDVMLPAGATGYRYLAAYRKWLGVENPAVAAPARPQRQHKVAASDLHLGGSAELVVLSNEVTVVLTSERHLRVARHAFAIRRHGRIIRRMNGSVKSTCWRRPDGSRVACGNVQASDGGIGIRLRSRDCARRPS